MFGKKKERRNWRAFGEYGNVEMGSDEEKIISLLELASKESSNLDKKLNLILSEMNLTYQPETEKKEPAKLVAKSDLQYIHNGNYHLNDLQYIHNGNYHLMDLKKFTGQNDFSITPKKKRGRPKKK